MKTDDREKLLDRIRKLYAMSRESESSPHEADIAMRRCQSLMAKFGITDSDLETSEFGKSRIGKNFRLVPSYVEVLASAVALLHDCLCVKGRTIEFRGFSIDAEVASMTYDYLTEVMERSLKARKRMSQTEVGRVEPGRSASFDYRVGFATKVLERAHKIDAERRAAEEALTRRASEASAGVGVDGSCGSSLVIRKRELVNEHCMEGLTVGRPKRVRYRDGSAHSAGSSDGANVSLDKQVSGSRQKAIT